MCGVNKMKTSGWTNDPAGAPGGNWRFRSLATALFFLALPGCAGAQLAWDALVLTTNPPLAAAGVQLNFCFANTNSTAIRVIGAAADCGCTAVNYPSNSILPGMRGQIVMIIDVTGEVGRLREIARVFTDTGGGPVYELTGIVEIPEVSASSPVPLNFDRVNPVEQMVVFTNLLTTPLRISSVYYDSAHPVFSAVSEIERGRIFGLRVKPSPAVYPYLIRFDVVMQQRTSGIEKHIRFQARVN